MFGRVILSAQHQHKMAVSFAALQTSHVRHSQRIYPLSKHCDRLDASMICEPTIPSTCRHADVVPWRSHLDVSSLTPHAPRVIQRVHVVVHLLQVHGPAGAVGKRCCRFGAFNSRLPRLHFVTSAMAGRGHGLEESRESHGDQGFEGRQTGSQNTNGEFQQGPDLSASLSAAVVTADGGEGRVRLPRDCVHSQPHLCSARMGPPSLQLLRGS